MPTYDRVCASGHEQIDCLESIETADPPCPVCGQPTKRAWLTHAASVRDDLIPGGLVIEHGLCWPDGTPRRFDSKLELQRAARAAHLENVVWHVKPDRGSDKAPYTKTWDCGPPPGRDPRPYALLSSEDQAIRRQETATRLGVSVDTLAAVADGPPVLVDDPDPVTAAIAREVALHTLVGHDHAWSIADFERFTAERSAP